MDRHTVDIYERNAPQYAARRGAEQPDRAKAFAASLPRRGMRLDLGCGPGHYLPHLGRPAVAADAAVGMLLEARRRNPTTPLVAGDLEALPIRPASLDGVWASKCVQHIPATRVPMALHELHRALRVGAILDMTVFEGRGEAPGPDRIAVDRDEFPGRLFTSWTPQQLDDVLVGAGFTIDEIRVLDATENRPIRRVVVRATRARSLADTVAPRMRVLVCGLNPSHYAADAGVGFARPGNRFWAAALAAGLVTVDRDPMRALHGDHVGMTDLVKRATVAASELNPHEFRSGLRRVESLVRWLEPGVVCFVGLAGWRSAVDRRAVPGVQAVTFGETAVYLMPSTSGLNARTSLGQLADHLGAAAGLADLPPRGAALGS